MLERLAAKLAGKDSVEKVPCDYASPECRCGYYRWCDPDGNCVCKPMYN